METSSRPGHERIAGGGLTYSVFPVRLLPLVHFPGDNAQTSAADILGTVTSYTGEAVPNGTVTLVNKDTKNTRTFQSDKIRALSVEMTQHNHAPVSSQSEDL
jgi:hypothetical protein